MHLCALRIHEIEYTSPLSLHQAILPSTTPDPSYETIFIPKQSSLSESNNFLQCCNDSFYVPITWGMHARQKLYGITLWCIKDQYLKFETAWKQKKRYFRNPFRLPKAFEFPVLCCIFLPCLNVTRCTTIHWRACGKQWSHSSVIMMETILKDCVVAWSLP